MSFWTDLVDAAVLGTGRAALPSPPPSLAGLAKDGAPSGAGDAGLLRLAAVASRARRASYSPPTAADLDAPSEAPPDHRRGVSVAARQRLAELLADEQEELVTEWLALLARAGLRPPDGLLPDLLWRAADSQRMREALTAVLGPRAAWLAMTNPAWDWTVTAGQAGPPDLDTWATASHRTRRQMLDQVRRTNPGAGRELVAATWPGDSPRDKAAFVAGLAAGLGDDDEPLLDRALTDSRGEVRQAAADLLAKLPGSAFSKRAAARAATAVQVPHARGRQLAVMPPGEATQEMIADGIDARPPKGTGLQAWLLRQVIAAAPAAWWTEYTGLPPADLLAIAAPTPWAAELETGWTESAMRDVDVPWLTALLDLPRRQADEMAIALLKALPAAERDSWLAAHPQGPLFAAIELAPAPWSAELSAVARDRIVAMVRAEVDQRHHQPSHHQPSHQTRVRRLLRVAAARLDPPVAPILDPAEVPQWLADGWAKMVNTLSVRAAMRRELTVETDTVETDTEEPTP